MQTFLQDLRYGVRMLVKQPGFTLIALLTLALGIGANTAIFSVVNAVLLRPLPYAEPERLVALGGTDVRHPGAEVEDSSSYPDFFDWRARNQSFEAVAVYHTATFTLTGNDAPAHLSGQVVSAELFDLLRAKPYLGRTFTRADERVGGTGVNRAAILSYSAWQQRFGAAPDILGRTLTLDRKQFQIVGVTQPGFQFPIQAEAVEVWVALATDAESANGKKPVTERRGYRMLHAVGRLKPGVNLAQAQADMKLLAANLEKEYPDNNTNQGIILLPLHRNLVGDYRKSLLVLFAAVGCVLLIACANVANLMLARATARYKEIAVRTALGAGRARIVRQLLTESVLLSLGGGLLGLLLAWWGMEALLRFIPENLPRLAEIALDRWALGFTFTVALLTGIVFGLAPALQASKVDLTEAMKDGARGSSSSGKARLRGALIVAEVALALMLLVGAGLLVQTFIKLQRVELGFDVHNVLTATVELPEAQYAKPEQKIVFYQRLQERVRALPGVIEASAILPLPISDNDAGGSFQIEGRSAPTGAEPHADMRWVNLNYYRTVKIPLLAGRDFTAQDGLKATPVVIINQTLAKLYFPNEEPLGKRLELPFGETGTTKFQIVGIVRDVKHRTELGQEYSPELYMPYAQLPFLGQMSLVVRTQGSPASLANAVQHEVAALDREIVLSDVKTLEQYLGNAVAQPRFSALLFGLFALLAMLLAALGLYSVMAYTVTQRTHEVGIRLALGAQTRHVLWLMIRQGMTLALAGVAIGLGGAWVLTRLLKTLLFGVSTTAPLTMVLIALLLTTVALLACWIPARRATKVDPMMALRQD
ncbi:MAG: ABC transporter permease [Acidobacteria bacterium]|nr:ABC transporter permease [Acidobacteriota bacterium]MBI3427115.1 ABC transporter permease [Acidobacteriota bacterium]